MLPFRICLRVPGSAPAGEVNASPFSMGLLILPTGAETQSGRRRDASERFTRNARFKKTDCRSVFGVRTMPGNAHRTGPPCRSGIASHSRPSGRPGNPGAGASLGAARGCHGQAGAQGGGRGAGRDAQHGAVGAGAPVPQGTAEPAQGKPRLLLLRRGGPPGLPLVADQPDAGALRQRFGVLGGGDGGCGGRARPRNAGAAGAGDPRAATPGVRT